MFINETTSELNKKYTLSLMDIILINEKIILPVAHFIHWPFFVINAITMTIMPNTNEIEKIFTPTLKAGAYKPSIFCMIDEPNESSFSVFRSIV